MAGLTIVLGTAGFSAGANYSTSAEAKKLLDAVKENGVTHLDTAQLYGDSEKFLGELHAGDTFNIDTKCKGGFDSGNALVPENLYINAHLSLETLKMKQVDIFGQFDFSPHEESVPLTAYHDLQYIHAPDDAIAPSTWLPTIDKLHKEGVFKRLGVSNFKADQVREVYDLAKSKNYVLPSVYQGNYSAVTRAQESELFPTLRELNIAFYAYSPMAGGFLAKTKQDLLDKSVANGRFSGKLATSSMYQSMYLKPTMLDALEEWSVAAKEQGVSQAELAYRWVSYHSPLKPEHGDAIIIGARTVAQGVETIQGLKNGPLKESVVKKIDDVWEKVKHEAPLDNYHSYAKTNGV